MVWGKEAACLELRGSQKHLSTDLLEVVEEDLRLAHRAVGAAQVQARRVLSDPQGGTVHITVRQTGRGSYLAAAAAPAVS